MNGNMNIPVSQGVGSKKHLRVKEWINFQGRRESPVRSVWGDVLGAEGCSLQCCWQGSMKTVASTVRLKTYYLLVPHIGCFGEVGKLN